MHTMRFSWAPLERLPNKEEIEGWILTLLAVVCGVDGNTKTGDTKPKGDEQSGKAVKGTELTKEIRCTTKRKRFTGDDPDGEDEPPKDKVHVKGTYMDFDEYLKVRHFIFVHHFCGAVDNLSVAVKEESEALGITVNTYSVDKANGEDLMKEEPYHTHRAAAAAGEIDGYHAGFPCNTFTKLRWRPVQGLPGPVRSKEFPYGFPDLNAKEARECNIGSVLMSKSVMIADIMFKSDRRMKVPSFATLENPPPSDVEPHISAWHMPEMVDLVDRNPDWKCAHFNTCAYEEDVDLGTRHYKPQMVGGNLIGIEALNKACPCGNRPHEPIVGKERSQKSAAYPAAFCREYGKLAAQHFLKIAKAEFLEGRLVVMQNRINFLKGAAADTFKEAMDVDEVTNTITKSDDYKRGLAWKEKTESERDKKKLKGEQAAEGGNREGGTPASSSQASSSQDLTWKGGHGKHGMLKEPKAKAEVPKALVYLGGMRDPHRAVVKLPTLQNLGTKMWERWQRFRTTHPKALEVAESYGTEVCEFNEEVVDLWRAELCDLWGADLPGVVLRPRGAYGTPVHHGMLAAWVRRSGDPDLHVPVWLKEGTPLGIEREIQCAGIFPPAEEEQEGTGTQEVADSVLERPETWTNYRSVEDDVAEAEIELNRYENLGYLRRIDAKTAEEVYRGGTISRLGLVLKTKKSGEKKRRIVIDLRRSGGNSKSRLPERLVLPRLTDAVRMMKEIRKRGHKPEDSGKDLELEITLVDVSDAFTVLPVAKEELKHTLAPSTKEGEVLVFQALLFGYKVAPLLYSRFAALVARMLQAGIKLDKGAHQVYLDDSLWVLQGTLEERTETLAYVLNTMGALGIRVALGKGSRANNATWIGVTLNVVDRDTLVLGLPMKFIEDLQGMLRKWEGSGYSPIKELRVVAGKTAWLGGVLPRARWVTSVFYAVLTQTLKEEEEDTPEKANRRNRRGLFAVKRLELARLWLINFLAAAKLRPMRRISLKTGQTAEVRIITDASPEALGGILNINGKIVAAFFSTVDEEQAGELLVEYKSSASQSVLETLAILVSLRRWSEKLKGLAITITVQSDSVTALALSQKLSAGGGSPGLNFLGSEVALCLEELGVEELRTSHVPGKANVEADFLSRPSTWGTATMPPGLEGVDICPEHGPKDGFYRLPTPKSAPSLWGTKGCAAGGLAVWEAVI